MSKHYYSLETCAQAIEKLCELARSPKSPRPRESVMGLLNEQAQQIIDTIRDPKAATAILEARGILTQETRR